jgi:pimeloyl-ACP methyl ester carboxylesterase
MKKPGRYGEAPFSVAVIHGGPGAAGETAPLARQLASGRGVLEPIQTALSLEGQVEELKTILGGYGDPPLVLIGFSWGAWLSFILAAKYPTCVKKLILIGSGPFEEKYAKGIAETRLARLTEKKREEAVSLLEILDSPTSGNKNATFAQLGKLISMADAYDPSPGRKETLEGRFDIFQNVWRDGAELRKSGRLLDLGKDIRCPVLAIHGDFDPHPAEGVREPLSFILNDFRFALLKNCGHKPWIERQAKDEFYRMLEKELSEPILRHPGLNFFSSIVY